MTYLRASGKRVDAEEIRRLYLVEKKSVVEIAGLLNCSYHTVLRSLKKTVNRKRNKVSGWYA